MHEKTINLILVATIITAGFGVVSFADTASADHIDNDSWDHFYPMEYPSEDNISDDFIVWDTYNGSSYDAVGLDEFYAIDGSQSLGMQTPVFGPSSNYYKDLWGITPENPSEHNYSNGVNMSVDFSPIPSDSNNVTLVEHSFMFDDYDLVKYDNNSFFVTLAYVEIPTIEEQRYFESPKIFMSVGGPPNTNVSCGQGFCEPTIDPLNPFPTMEPDWGPDDNRYVENVSNIDIKADSNQIYVNLSDYGNDAWGNINNTEPVSTWENTVNLTQWIGSGENEWNFGVFSTYSAPDYTGDDIAGFGAYVVYDNLRLNEGSDLVDPDPPDPGEGEFDDPELSLNVDSTTLDAGETTSYTVTHNNDGVVTDNSNVYVENTDLLTVNQNNNTITATSDETEVNTSTYVVTEYQDLQDSVSVYVGSTDAPNIPGGGDSPGGIDDELQFSPLTALLSLAANTTMQVIVLIALLNSFVAKISSPFAGLGVTIALILIAYAGGFVPLGVCFATIIIVILLGINLKNTQRSRI